MEVLAMGGYGSYVWGSFGLTLVVLVVTMLQAGSHHKKIYREIEQRLKAMEDVT